jgi:3-methyladenine DNA glycosylase AlkD
VPPIDPVRAAKTLTSALRKTGDPARAEGERAYLKSDLRFFGTRVPDLRAAVKAFLREHPDLDRRALIGLVEALWSQPVFETRAAAVELLALRGDLLEARDMNLVERLLRDSHTWALVDGLAPGVAGPLFVRFPKELGSILDGWARDDDFWVRRASMLTLLVPLRRGEGDFDRFARYADAMLEEREFFIRKAIGWILREVSKQRPELVAGWLLPRAGRASGVTVREAVKYLSPKQRDAIMRAYRTK